MKRAPIILLFLFTTSIFGLNEALPEFTQNSEKFWFNSKPLSIKKLRGKVVLLDVWTSNCINCERSVLWIKHVERKFMKKNLQLIGIHSPEFEDEKNRSSVLRKINKYGYNHPVMMDNDFSYWYALNNQAWPAFYIADKKGRIRGHFIGEMHAGDKRADQAEKLITELLEEP